MSTPIILLFQAISMMLGSIVCVKTGSVFFCFIGICLILGAIWNLMSIGAWCGMFATKRKEADERTEKVKNWTPQ